MIVSLSRCLLDPGAALSGSPLRKSEMTYGERPIYGGPPLGGLSQDDVIGPHLA